MNKTLTSAILLFIISSFTSLTPVYAQGGENAASPGAPGRKPLALSSVILENGRKLSRESRTSLEPKFTLNFDKNVVNMLYWENNAKCFSLVSQDNQNVALKVTKIDDTVDFSMRRTIFIQPVSKLKSATTYHLKIAPNLQTKNGILLSSTSPQGITIDFTTKALALAEATKSHPTAIGTKDQPNQVTAHAAASNGKLMAVKKPVEKAGTQGNQQNEEQGISFLAQNWLTIVTVLLMIGWAIVEVKLKYKKQPFKKAA